MWQPPKMWEGGTCWIIGGGPSVLQQFNVPLELQDKLKKQEVSLAELSPYLSALHEKHTIGINMAYQLGCWIDFVVFGDKAWYFYHRWGLAETSSIKVSCSPCHKNWNENNSENIKYMGRNNEKKRGISTDPGLVAWNKNSGAAAISLAVQLGVKRVNLVGFDASPDSEGYTHWHGAHHHKSLPVKEKTFNRIASTFEQVMKDAEQLGIELYNINPQSGIQEVPHKPLNELLKEDS